MGRRAPWLLALAALARTALAQIKVVTPRDVIPLVGPSNERGTIKGTTATFGAPFFGERILGRVFWGETQTNKTHCTSEDYELPNMEARSEEEAEEKMINIVMVRRGQCTFVTKVLVAAAKGAHAVIFIDPALDRYEIQKLIIGDDGYGVNVNIPSVLISKEDGEPLIEAAKKGDLVVELKWDIPAREVVTLDLWMSTGNSESMKFLKELAPKRRALNDAIMFVPHFDVQVREGSSDDFHELCIGKYCAMDPDKAGPITGAMVLKEDVRQLCIHEVMKVAVPAAIGIKKSVMYAKEYWDYVEQYAAECPFDGKDEEHRFGTTCSERLMQKIGINSQAVTCDDDELLRKQAAERAWSPTALRINGWRYTGKLDADLVVRAICTGFTEAPLACRQFLQPMNPFNPLGPPKQEGGVSFQTLAGTLSVFGLVTVGAMVLYKRAMTHSIHTALREEVMLEVQAQMDQYKPM